jgi:hypothetical protein
VARATSRLCRRAFPDVLSGAEIVEDILDGVVVDVVDDTTQAPQPAPALQRKRAPRKPAATRGQPPAEPKPAPAAVDELDDFPDMTLSTLTEPEPPPVSDEEEAEPPLITDAQIKKLSILLRENGFDAREARHDFVAAAIGRIIGSSKELTRDEASRVIDILAENDIATQTEDD